jgi:hypothetical protein
MAEYKCVPVGNPAVNSKSFTLETGAGIYQKVINEHASDGWMLLSIRKISLHEKQGCLKSLLSRGSGSSMGINMLVFVRGEENFMYVPGNAYLTPEAESAVRSSIEELKACPPRAQSLPPATSSPAGSSRSNTVIALLAVIFVLLAVIVAALGWLVFKNGVPGNISGMFDNRVVTQSDTGKESVKSGGKTPSSLYADVSTPVPGASSTSAKRFSAGGSHTVFIRDNKTVSAVGSNAYNQCAVSG